MKKNITKGMALLLSTAVVLTSFAVNTSYAGAATKPFLRSKKITMKVGTSKKLKLVGKSIKKTAWSVKNKKIATLSSKKKTSVMVKGKKKGTTTVNAKVSYGKKNGKLSCKVVVTNSLATTKPVQTNTPAVSNTPAKTNTPVVTNSPVVSATPEVSPTRDPVETEKPIDLSTYSKMDLSTYTTGDGSTGAYDEAAGTLHIVDKENFQFKLPVALTRGDTLKVVLQGSYNGTVGFRSWLVDGNQTTNSNLVNTNNETDFKGGNFELSYGLTALTSSQYLFFKGPSPGVNIDDLLVTTIYYKIESDSEGDTTNDPYTPKTEQAYDTADLQLTTSFSEQKGTIGNNPLITQSFTADPTAIEYNGRLYVFGTSDKIEFDTKGNVISNSYNTCELQCISSADLVNWTDHGTIKVSDAAKWAGHSWAPTITSKEIDGQTKFFLYFANGGDGIGVLTADSPLGPWKDPIGKRLISRDTANCSEAAVPWLFDPGVLVDDKGDGYLYFGGGTTGLTSDHPKSSRVVKLSEDMTSLAEDPVELDANYLFEDNEINQINGKYVYSYCTNWSVPTTETTTGTCCIAFMTSDSPTSGFEYQGQLFANPGGVFGNYYNNHHKLIQFKNEWYIIYHTTLLEETAYGTKMGYRTLHMDKLNVGTDSADKLTLNATATYAGLDAVDTLNPYNETEAVTMAWSAGLRTEESTSLGKMVLSSINTGDWYGISDVDFGSNGATSITMNLASQTTEGKIEIYQDAPSTTKGGTKVGEVLLENTGDKDTYKEISAKLTPTVTGKHKMYFVFRGTGYHVANWQFTK